MGPAALLAPLVQIQELTASFVSPFIQMAGIAAMTGPQNHVEAWRFECAGLASAVVDRLNAVDGVHCPLPQGATFVFPRFSMERTSVQLAGLLVEDQGVVITPGIGFGESGEGHVRIALMRSPAERVLEGVERIVTALETL